MNPKPKKSKIQFFCGIDLAASPSKTRVCVLSQNSRGKLKMVVSPMLFNLHGDSWEQAFEDLSTKYSKQVKCILQNPEVSVVVGIDVPFGWPRSFVNAIGKHSTLSSKSYGWGTREGREKFRFRETDTLINKTVFKTIKDLYIQGPLSVSTDRLGVTAMVGAELIHHLIARWNFSVASPFKTPSLSKRKMRSIIEVYPKASVTSHLGSKAFRFGRPHYSEWKRKFGNLFAKPESIAFRVVDEWDAWICALTARDYYFGNCIAAIPRNSRQKELFIKEGWIWAPRKSTDVRSKGLCR